MKAFISISCQANCAFDGIGNKGAGGLIGDCEWTVMNENRAMAGMIKFL
jgi:hypothetical protein